MLTTELTEALQRFLDSGRMYGRLVLFVDDLSGRLVIAIEDDLSLDEMAEFLRAFASVYRRLGQIADLEGRDQDLQARRIESGSWLMDFAGHPAVLGVLGGVVPVLFAWGHRTYTKEGRTKTFMENLDAAQKALGLREKFKDAGFNVDHLDGALQDLERDVARDLGPLFESRRRVRVDNTVYARIDPVFQHGDWPELTMEIRNSPPPPPPSLFITDERNEK